MFSFLFLFTCFLNGRTTQAIIDVCTPSPVKKRKTSDKKRDANDDSDESEFGGYSPSALPQLASVVLESRVDAGLPVGSGFFVFLFIFSVFEALTKQTFQQALWQQEISRMWACPRGLV